MSATRKNNREPHEICGERHESDAADQLSGTSSAIDSVEPCAKLAGK